MQKIEIQAHIRTNIGRSTKALRSVGTLPGVLYGNNFKSISLEVPTKTFEKVYSQAGESTLVYVKLDDQTYPAIINDVAVDAIHGKFLHVDFYKVRLDEKIKAKVPIVVVGEAPAIKDLGGILVKNVNEVEVEGLPQDLPHQLEVDISGLLQFRDHVQIKDLKVPAGVEIKANPEEIIALIQEPISEEKLKESLETAPAAGVDDVEVIKKEKAEPADAEGSGEATEAAEPAKEEKK